MSNGTKYGLQVTQHCPACNETIIQPTECALTKREYACIHLGVPKTGDAELDVIISEGAQMRFAAMAMQGTLAHKAYDHDLAFTDDCAADAINAASMLLAELEDTD